MRRRLCWRRCAVGCQLRIHDQSLHRVRGCWPVRGGRAMPLVALGWCRSLVPTPDAHQAGSPSRRGTPPILASPGQPVKTSASVSRETSRRKLWPGESPVPRETFPGAPVSGQRASPGGFRKPRTEPPGSEKGPLGRDSVPAREPVRTGIGVAERLVAELLMHQPVRHEAELAEGFRRPAGGHEGI